jgi:hypothetical protein
VWAKLGAEIENWFAERTKYRSRVPKFRWQGSANYFEKLTENVYYEMPTAEPASTKPSPHAVRDAIALVVKHLSGAPNDT